MRSSAEIVAYLHEIDDKAHDALFHAFDFRLECCIGYLSFEEAQPWLKPEADWKQDPLSDEGVLDLMRDYMEFAWEKAENHRGLSALRSVNKMRHWCWLLGRDGLVYVCGDAHLYSPYGAPILKRISEAFGFPIPEGKSIARMMDGRPCRPDCEEGCF